MRELLRKAQTRAGMAVVGGVLLAGAGVGTAAAVVGSPDTAEVADVEPVPSEPAATTTAAATTQAESTAPTADTPATTVPGVIEPAPADAPQPQTTPAVQTPQVPADAGSYDPDAPWVDPQSGLTYVPAPDVPIEKLPGEPGYVPPS